MKLVRRVWSVYRSVEKHDTGKTETEVDRRDLSLWERVLGLIEQDLDQRRTRKLFVEVQGKSGSYHKEKPDRGSPEEITLFKSLGLAVEDVATAKLIHRGATTAASAGDKNTVS